MLLIIRMKNILTVIVSFLFTNAFSMPHHNSKAHAQTFHVTMLPAENGSYTITPKIPADGKVAAGTQITIKANPAKGYSLDAVFYTVKGGMWGTTSYENFTPEMKVTVDKDMQVGAIFVAQSLVNNLKVTHDVVYAKPGNKALKYDVYAPKAAKNLPCIVIIHGGGWSSNNEDIMRGLARELTKENKYVVISIDYRWVNKLDGDAKPNYMHQLIEDVFGAIAHIREHAAEYGVDPDHIAVTGDSAGGHLSESAGLLSILIGDGGFGEKEGVYELMPGYIPANKTVAQLKKELIASIKAVAPSYGPSDAQDFKMFIEQKDNQQYLDAVSPIKHIPDAAQRALPHFIVRGTKDPIISQKMVQTYVDKLKAAGHKTEYLEVEGAGHAFFDWKPDATTIATFNKYGVPYAAKMRVFFDEVFY